MIPPLKANTNIDPELSVWLWSCSHLRRDIDDLGIDNLELAFSQVDGVNGFDYDFSINHGDFDANQDFPSLDNPDSVAEGQQIPVSFGFSTEIREKHYTIAGNHDGGDGQMDWFLRYVDPLGDNTAFSGVDPSNMPYQQILMEPGSWHSYYITTGKYMFIMLSDRNELPFPYGRGGSVISGGHPSGTLTRKTWEWVKDLILKNKNKNIFISTHQGVRNTVIATGDYEGFVGKFHGESGIAAGNGSIYSIYDEDTGTDNGPDTEILQFFADNPNHTVVGWHNGHTHYQINETFFG